MRIIASKISVIVMNFRKITSTHFIHISLLLCITFGAIAQGQQPKLVVGIVVDQMRHEYLYRYNSKFGEDGFKRLMTDGFVMKNAHYNYVPTYTGPGHASIYTGTTPAVHGIIANSWYDKVSKSKVYCAQDDDQKVVGSETGYGKISTKRMLSTTISDELRLSTQMKSKVIAVSIKDRGASLPGGHTANAAYWYDVTSGNFISSTFYMNALPIWVQNFNNQKLVDKYMSQKWTPVLPIKEYTESTKDDAPYERVPPSMSSPTFPYDFKKITEKTGRRYAMLPMSPFGNSLVAQMSIATLENENLGKDEYTDLLAVSFSATDVIGHSFGPNSIEVEDTYIRLDQDIASLLTKLDEQVGKGNYTVFLTADHAVVDIPQSLIDKKIPAGYFNTTDAKTKITKQLNELYGEGEWVESVGNMQVFLNHELINEKKINSEELSKKAAAYTLALNGISATYTSNEIKIGDFSEGGIKGSLIRGYHQKRSGDILFVMEPAWYEGEPPYGTTHGSGYTYDTHVPMIFYGWGIKRGSSVKYHPITDIAPTISALLNIKFPNGTTGNPIEEIFK